MAEKMPIFTNEQTATAPAPAATPIGPIILAGVAGSVASSVMLFAMLLGAAWFGVLPIGPAPDPLDVDPLFVALGEAYTPDLAATYAASWMWLADQIDAGSPIGEATTEFSDRWRDRREALFDAKLRGPLQELLPDGATEDQITPRQRRAYAAACRGVAEGLVK